MAQTCRLINGGGSSVLGIYQMLNFHTGNFFQEMISGGPYCMAGLPVTHAVMQTKSTPMGNFLEAHNLARDLELKSRRRR
jgi:hypothetical protein